ncbi:MAG: hypothetical protein ACI9J3_001491 [Parvicellaceae bacterium]|jgi:hypothetical protein
MQKILSISYSQSGQLHDIVDNFTAPIENAEIDRIHVQPKQVYPFPWNTKNFYDGMPETVLEEPIELETINFKEDKYDLIILGYQPWFLSPSMPATALLKNPEFKRRLKNTPVITVIGARNMWLNAQESMVALVEAGEGEVVGNIALTDRAPNHLSAISIVHWMMTGEKTRKWGIFPKPGVSDKDIQEISKYGPILNKVLPSNNYLGFQKAIVEQGAVRINTSILFIEGKAKKIFRIWAGIIKKKEAQGKSRSFWIAFFRRYLNIALFGVAPILLFFYTLLIRPFTVNKIRRKKEFFTFLGIETGES